MSTLHFNALVPPFDLGEGTAVEELEKANLLTYGADSTGVAPSDTALKEALENSSIVYAPKGTYLFNEEHQIKGQVVIYGDGQNLTTFKTTSNTNASILNFLNAGCQVHDLKLEGPLTSAVTGGTLLSFQEETFDESGLITSSPKGWTEARHITTVGGFNQILISKCVGVVIKDWIGTEVRNVGLNVFGERPSKACNLVYLLDTIVSGKKGVATVQGSVAIKIVAGEAMTFAHVDTEYCEVGMLVEGNTENSWFTDMFFDVSQGTGLIVGASSKGCNFDKIWSNSEGVGGGLLIGPLESLVENCTFTNCWFFTNVAELGNHTAVWKEISETEYKALASKKGVWKVKTVYAVKDGVEHQQISGEFPLTGGGIRFYECLKVTKAFNPRLSGGENAGFANYEYQTLKATYALKDTVQEGAKFYENIKAITPEAEATSARKPTGTEGATFWKEITEAEFLEGDFVPVSAANGITVGPAAKETTIIGCGIRRSQNNAVHVERAGLASEQNINVIGCQMNEYKGFGLRIGKNQENINILGNAFISIEGRGSISNDATGGFVVFNTGANEFLTAKMSKPAEQQAALEGVQQFASTAAANVRAQLVTYKTKADVETKVKHTLNSTCVLSVVAYKYVTSKYGSKMELAAKHVESFTVNSASEITIKWSSTLEAKEEIAIVIQAA